VRENLMAELNRIQLEVGDKPYYPGAKAEGVVIKGIEAGLRERMKDFL